MIADDHIAGLYDLLREENAALIVADFETVNNLAPRKQELFASLQNFSPTTKDLQGVLSGLSRNQTLLDAAIQGIKAARQRLDSLQDVRSGLKVYNHTGQMAQVRVDRPDVVKKA